VPRSIAAIMRRSNAPLLLERDDLRSGGRVVIDVHD
jgi:hypothetical protein